MLIFLGKIIPWHTTHRLAAHRCAAARRLRSTDLGQWCPTFFDPRSTFQVDGLLGSTNPVSTSQTHTHCFQPAVSIFTALFLVATRPLDLTCHITSPSSLKHVCTLHTHTNLFDKQ